MANEADGPGPGIWEFGRVVVDERLAALEVDGTPVALDRSSHDVLLALLRGAGGLVTKDALLAAGWPGRMVSENSLSKAIGRLRGALGEDGRALRAIHGYGYRLTADVSYRPAPLATDAALPAAAPGLRVAETHGDPELREAGDGEGGPAAPVRTPHPPRGRRWPGVALLAVLAVALVSSLAMYASAERALRQAEDTAAQRQAMLVFVTRDILGQADPYRGQGAVPAATLDQAIDNAADAANRSLEGAPAERAAVQYMLGTIRFGQDRHAAAEAAFLQSRTLYRELGRRHGEALVRAGTALCDVYRIGDRLDDAEAACGTALQDARTHGGSEALALLKLGQLRGEQGRQREALELLQPLLREEAFAGDPRLLGELHWAMGLARRAQGRYPEARRHFVELLAIARAGGEESSWTAWAFHSLGSVLVELGDYDRAEALLLAARGIFRKVQGPAGIEAQMPDIWRADIRLRRAQWDEAGAMLRAQLAAWEGRLAPDHPLRLRAEASVAWSDAMAGKPGQAAMALRAALAGKGALAADRTAGTRLLRWIRVALALEDPARAERLLALFDARVAATLPDPHPLRAEAECLRARWARHAGRTATSDRAAAACRKGLALFFPAHHPLRVEAGRHLSPSR